MKLSDRIYYDKVDNPDKLTADERRKAGADPELSRALAENRSLSGLGCDPGPAPDRSEMLSRVYRSTQVLEEPKMTLLQRLFEGKRWYAQLGLATGLAAIILALAVFLPTDSGPSPQPAFARTDGYRLNYNLGPAPNLANAKLAGPGTPLFSNLADDGNVVKTSKTVKVVTSDDLTEEELAEIKESLGLMADGDLDIIKLDSFIEGMETEAGQMLIYVTDPDEARIEKIITGAVGEAVELDEIHVSMGEDGEYKMFTMVISKPQESVLYLDGAEEDSEFIVSLERMELEGGLSESLKELEADIEVIRLDLSELELDINENALIVGLDGVEEGLAAIDLEQLRAELDEETLKEVQVALEEARAGISAIDLTELKDLVELGELGELAELAELQELGGVQFYGDIEKVVSGDIAIALAEIEELKLDELQLTIEHQAELAEAKEQLQAAMVVLGDTDLNEIVMQIDEVSTIDLSEIETVIDEFKTIRIDKDGTPIDIETQIVDGELITSICVVGDDVEAIDELKIVLSETMTNLPDPEVTTSTWFYDKGSAEMVVDGGMAISVMGNYFTFPDGASTEEIQAELDSWFKEHHPDSGISTSIKVIDGSDPNANQYVVMANGDDITWTANYCRMEDGNIIITTGEDAVNIAEIEIEEVDGTFSIYVEAGEGEDEKFVVVTTDEDEESDDGQEEKKKVVVKKK